jgi:S-adenosylmethionine-diacylgycerolhomoserine-N-methlytransferase
MADFIFMNAHTDVSQEHGDAMDRMYRWQRHIYDVSRRYYLLGRNEMLQGIAAKPGQSILEIGCGTGRNLALAAKLYPSAKLFGIDISNQMLKTANANLRNAGVAAKVQLAQGDATNFDAKSCFQTQAFDHIYFSYTLSMVPQWQQAIEHAFTILGTNGQLHMVDFGQCEGWPSPLKQLMFRWLKHFDVTPRSNMAAVLTAFAKQHGMKLRFEKSYGGYVYRGAFESLIRCRLD